MSAIAKDAEVLAPSSELPGAKVVRTAGGEGADVGDGGSVVGDGGSVVGDGGAVVGDGGAVVGDGGAVVEFVSHSWLFLKISSSVVASLLTAGTDPRATH